MSVEGHGLRKERDRGLPEGLSSPPSMHPSSPIPSPLPPKFRPGHLVLLPSITLNQVCGVLHCFDCLDKTIEPRLCSLRIPSYHVSRIHRKIEPRGRVCWRATASVSVQHSQLAWSVNPPPSPPSFSLIALFGPPHLPTPPYPPSRRGLTESLPGWRGILRISHNS